jgi:hypothetical protein
LGTEIQTPQRNDHYNHKNIFHRCEINLLNMEHGTWNLEPGTWNLELFGIFSLV